VGLAHFFISLGTTVEDEAVARIEEVVQPVLRDHGLELVDLEWRGQGPRGVLRLFVDKPGGVGIGDCERASRELGDVIDAADVIARGYDLEVSSPGLDRQLRSERELRWGVGRRVRCWLAGGRELAGRLAAAGPASIELDTAEGRLALPRAEVTKLRLDPDVRWPRRGASP
jgi:ribosome maturation factor RimP